MKYMYTIVILKGEELELYKHGVHYVYKAHLPIKVMNFHNFFSRATNTNSQPFEYTGI